MCYLGLEPTATSRQQTFQVKTFRLFDYLIELACLLATLTATVRVVVVVVAVVCRILAHLGHGQLALLLEALVERALWRQQGVAAVAVVEDKASLGAAAATTTRCCRQMAVGANSSRSGHLGRSSTLRVRVGEN